MNSKSYPQPCKEIRTNVEKDWPYDEYYTGERDDEGRKTGTGEYFWSGAESLECYTGSFLRDTKHGVGQYNCRHRGTEGSWLTWEGNYYNNNMHGYGLMSYHNGRVFSGLYHSNLRWGPGVETHINLRENVGLWHGDQLVRLTWKPPFPSVVPDLLSTPTGVQMVSKYRTILKINVKKVGEINPALELLKKCGAPPLIASSKWPKLYPNNCTDQRSQFFYADAFDREFYGNKILTLERASLADAELYEFQKKSRGSITSDTKPEVYYAWNNNTNVIHIMNHCFKHDFQMKYPKMNLEKILNGPRSYYKPAAQAELDCRTFLMACYLGQIKNVSQLMNEYDVHLNVTDMQGNSGIMYAVCGNQKEVIHFLVEAGGLINDYNDACCTPLGVALLNFACTRCDVPPSQLIEAIMPHDFTSSENVCEWIIERIPVNNNDSDANNKPLSGKAPNGTLYSNKKSRQELQEIKTVVEPVETCPDDKRLYFNLLHEFSNTIKELLKQYEPVESKTTIPYIFETHDMVAELDLNVLQNQIPIPSPLQKKVPDKKDGRRISREVLSFTEGPKIMPKEEPMKIKRLNDQMKTIELLLEHGADPCRVKCPQSAIFIAIAAQSSELVELLTKHGADTNEKNPDCLDYTPLEFALSRPLTQDNLEVIEKLLEGGADVKKTITIDNNSKEKISSKKKDLGPTLLHIALEKNVDEAGEKIYLELLKLLLHYGCNPIAQYRGSSAMEQAMSKSLDVFNIFIESPNTDLNAVINDSNQTILIKMFSMSYCKYIPVAQRLQMLTFLLLYGADPLRNCEIEGISYVNLFEYTKQIEDVFNAHKAAFAQRENAKGKQDKADTKKKDNADAKKKDNGDAKKKDNFDPKKKDNAADAKTLTLNIKGGLTGEDFNDYIQTLCLVKDCARILHIRWIQANLMKELIELVDKYKHRNWTMILREYKKGKRCGLWLTSNRCLEIWNILTSTKKRVYSEKTVLKCVLYIVQFHCKKQLKLVTQMSSEVKTATETEVNALIRQNASVTLLQQVTKGFYVRPELTPANEVNKFNICFECALPLKEHKIICSLCKLVSFCSYDCMRGNIDRLNCHPCSSYLKEKYFPVIEEASESSEDMH